MNDIYVDGERFDNYSLEKAVTVTDDGEVLIPVTTEFLYALGLIFNEPYYDTKEQYCYHNNGIPEAFMYRGGFWGSGAFAGVFCWSASVGRIYKYEGNSFRASYVPLE